MYNTYFKRAIAHYSDHLQFRNVSAKTVKRYTNALETFHRDYWKVQPTDYKTALILHINKNGNPNARAWLVSVFKGFYRYLIMASYYNDVLTESVVKDLADSLVAVKKDYREAEFLDMQILRGAYDQLIQDNMILDACVWGSFIFMGVRCAELADFANWRFVGNHSIIVKGKGGRERTIAVPQFFYELLLSVSADDMPHEEYYIREIVADLGKRMRLAEDGKRIHPHLLRHSYATHLYRQGVSIYDLQRVLGHSSTRTTTRYIHGLSPLSAETMAQAFK